MILLGDIHGDPTPARTAAEMYPNQTILQVGDFGFGFSKRTDAALLALPSNVKFIRGNHDNPVTCKDHPGYLGDFGFQNIDGLGVFYLGGAWSIDKDCRTPGFDWWPEEELSDQKLEEAFNLFQAVAENIDVVVTHEAPSAVIPFMFPWVGDIYPNRTAQALNLMFRHYPVPHWYFGHWHPADTVTKEIEGTKFCGLAIDRIVAHQA